MNTQHTGLVKHQQQARYILLTYLAPIGVTLCLTLLWQASAVAMNLGEITLESTYGQPLRATLPISISRGEILKTGCITPMDDPADEGFATLKELTISVPAAGVPGIYTISISSPYRLTEPMYNLSLRIACTGSSNFIRSYTIIPEVKNSGTVISTPEKRSAIEPDPSNIDNNTDTDNTMAPEATTSADAITPLAANSRYRVEAVDSLSTIAARIDPAWGSLKKRGEALVLLNPHAFVAGDPQRIQAGTIITIPAGMPADKQRDNTHLVSAQTATGGNNLPPTGTDAPPSGMDSSALAPTSPVALSAPAVSVVATSSANVPASTGASATLPQTAETPPLDEAAIMAAAYARAREIADTAAKNARAAELQAGLAEDPQPTQQGTDSGSLLVAVIIGGLIGIIVSLLIMGRRMLLSKRQLRQPAIDPETAPRYANDDDFVAPVDADHLASNGFVVDEGEDFFRQTLASDEHASRLMARLEDSQKTPRNRALDSSDRLPKASVNSSFLDSDPDLFDASSNGPDDSKHLEEDTLQGIFNQALFTDAEDPDAPSEKRVQAAKNATENVQRLAKTAEDQEDDHLSATLADALHLLEQDYQEELTASQVLNPDAVKRSLRNKQKG